MVTLRKIILKWYDINAHDVYREEPELFEVLAAMVVDHVMNVYYIRPPNYVHPATWILALVGPQGRGKSTIMGLTKTLYRWGGLKPIGTGSPEAIIEDIHRKVKEDGYGRLYLFWDEAGAIKDKQGSYLATLEYWVNRMYYSDELKHITRTRQEIKVEKDSYMINLMFGAIDDQWAQIEQNFNKGFGRRAFPVLINVDLPLLTDIDFTSLIERVKLEPRLHWALRKVSGMQPIIGLDKVSKYDTYLKKLDLPLTKKMALSEYGLKFAIGRLLGEAFEVPEEEELKNNSSEAWKWAMENFMDRLENWADAIFIEDTNGKILREKLAERKDKTEKNMYIYNPHNPQYPQWPIQALQVLRPDLDSPTLRISMYLRVNEGYEGYDDIRGIEGQIRDENPSISDGKKMDEITSTTRPVHPQLAGVKEGYLRSPTLADRLPFSALTQLQLPELLAPHSYLYALRTLARILVTPQTAPSPELVELKYRIKMALNDGAPPVLTYTRFIKEIFHTKDTSRYEKLLQLAEEAKVIRIVGGKWKTRTVKYVVLDTSRRICGNCLYYGTRECPRFAKYVDVLEGFKHVKPWDDACERFEPFLLEEVGEDE